MSKVTYIKLLKTKDNTQIGKFKFNFTDCYPAKEENKFFKGLNFNNISNTFTLMQEQEDNQELEPIKMIIHLNIHTLDQSV